MRTRKVIALSLISAGAAVLFSGCPDQPAGPCVVARAGAGPFSDPGVPYATHYYFTSESGNCSDPAVDAGWPARDFTGALWAEAYGNVSDIDKPTGLVPEEFGWTSFARNRNNLRDYVECTPLNADLYALHGIGGGYDGGACVDDPISHGAFTTDAEDSNGLCTIAEKAAGSQVVNGVFVTYSFPKSILYVPAASGEGTQIQVPVVTITRQALGSANVCVRTYQALGLWPSALCNVDNDCNANPQPNNTPPRPIGSGLLTHIPVFCDMTIPTLDPIIVPNGTLPDGGPGPNAICGNSVPTPYLSLTPNCGGSKDNNGTAGTGNCFYSNASPTTFPYTN